MRPSSLLVVLPALCLACDLLPAQMPPNNQSEWTTSGGPDTSASTNEPVVTATSASDDTTPAIATHASGPRLVSLPDGTTTVGIPLGTDTGPGPMLVEPVTGGPPQLGTPLD